MSRLPGALGARDIAMCRVAERFQAGRMLARGVGALHVAKMCKAPPRYQTCADRGEKYVPHASGSGSYLIFSSISGEGRKARTF